MKSIFCQLYSIHTPLKRNIRNVGPCSDPSLKSPVQLVSTHAEEPTKWLRDSRCDVEGRQSADYGEPCAVFGHENIDQCCVAFYEPVWLCLVNDIVGAECGD